MSVLVATSVNPGVRVALAHIMAVMGRRCTLIEKSGSLDHLK